MSYTVIGFDVGSRKVGVAVGQSVTRSAQGLDVVAMHKGQPDWQRLTVIIDEWRPDKIVVGMPKTADGTTTPLMKLIHRFARQLAERFQLEVSFIDETLSSAEADYRIRSGTPGDATRARKSAGKKRIGKRDSVAAELIVETWFNSQS